MLKFAVFFLGDDSWHNSILQGSKGLEGHLKSWMVGVFIVSFLGQISAHFAGAKCLLVLKGAYMFRFGGFL